MQNNDNQKNYFIYLRSTGEKVPVTKAQHDSFYKEADRIRHKEQDHGRFMCPYRFIWKCDSDCLDCEYHASPLWISRFLMAMVPVGDYIPDRSKAMYDFKLPLELSDTEIEVILSKIDELASWAAGIKEYALQKALSGKGWTGFKLVEGRSVRKYPD